MPTPSASSDRNVVERAISSWFAGGGETEAKNPLPEAHTTSGVDLRAIERFEGDVRGGMTHRMIMRSVGKQPGLLRVRDLLLICYTVWIPGALDFSVKGVGRGNDMVTALMFLVTPIGQGLGCLAMAAVASALFRDRTHWPMWLLYVVGFVVSMISMVLVKLSCK